MKNRLDKEINKQDLNDVISLTKRILKILYIVFIACLILVGLYVINYLTILTFVVDVLTVISPFFIGFVIAWILRPIVLKLNTKIHNNTISSVIVFLVMVIIMGVVLYAFIPTVYNEVNEMVGLLPSFIERLTSGVNDFFLKFESSGLNLGDFPEKLLSTINNYGAEIASGLPNTIINIIVSLFSGIGTFVMGLIIGIYMLIDYENIGRYFKKMFSEKFQKDITKLSSRISSEVRKCVNGTFLVAFMVLICDSVGFALVGLRAPILFGLFCGLTDLIPFIGPYIGGALAVIVGLTQDPLIGIGALIICVIVQIVENYILQPIVMSKASQTHPILIIIALLVFGHFFGIIGMVLAAPTLTLLRVILEFIKEKIDERRKLNSL